MKQTDNWKTFSKSLKGLEFCLFFNVILNIKAYQNEGISENDKLRLRSLQSLKEISG